MNVASRLLAFAGILSLATIQVSAAGVLSNGNSQLPACAQTCMLLNQAAQACGGTASADQGIWSCFCQSGYLKSLYSSDAGICDAYCTDASDSQQVSTWYKSNCGTDNGVSEHAGDAAAAPTTSSTTSSSTPGSTSSSFGSGGSTGITILGENDSSWWPNHYKWIIMLIVLLVGFVALAFLAVWLKRRYERKQDRINGGFNAGITERSAPMSTASRTGPIMAGDNFSRNASGVLEPMESGMNSPARTRDSYPRYGTAESRSDSRLPSRTQTMQSADTRRGTASPLARELDPAVISEKDGSMRRPKRIMVREKSVEGPGTPAEER